MLNWLFQILIVGSYDRPKRTFAVLGTLTVFLCLFIPTVKIDVDPENMLPESEPARVFHNLMKERMDIQDMIILGITNDAHPEGVFNPESLSRIAKLSQFIYGLEGVVNYNLLAPDHIDAIEPAGPGTVRFQRLMKEVPKDKEGSLRIRDLANANPFLKGSMISEDGKGMSFYVPIEAKDLSWGLSKEINAKIEELNGTEDYHVTGLPVAEDTFGVEMFIQMAISAPMAMGLITLLMWYFFGNFRLVAGSMMTALISVLITMGLFMATGQTLHIMSSMIPIFIMPIAVLDDIHVLSQFYDKYNGDARRTIIEIMEELWTPMIYTSITSAAGFMSLALAPIPPVRIFGIFTGIGILVAWAVTMSFLPAYIASLSKERLASFGQIAKKAKSDHSKLDNFLGAIGRGVWNRAWIVIVFAVVVATLSVIGINRIKVNDNPMKWFEPSHPIRTADKVMNARFAGNYIVYLSLTQHFEKEAVPQTKQALIDAINAGNFNEQGKVLQGYLNEAEAADPIQLLMGTRSWISQKTAGPVEEKASSDDEEPDFEMDEEDVSTIDSSSEMRTWLALDALIAQHLIPFEAMKDPEMLRWMEEASKYLESTGLIAKANSVSDLVKKINKELHEGEESYYTIPDTAGEVMETYVSFQSSHDLHRLWNMITQDYGSATFKFQLKSGDNHDVEMAVIALNEWMAKNKPPHHMEPQWFGLSYINILWQQKMVKGMSDALKGSALVVLVCMLILLRSIWWALLSFIPLGMAISSIYGSIGLIGKDYDMPVAVISALALGLAVDFAIHFIVCLRQLAQDRSPADAMEKVFHEPARGIWRNAIVVSLGFTPLLIAPLVPYQTVGLMMASILVASVLSTLLILPAVIRIGRKLFFKEASK